ADMELTTQCPQCGEIFKASLEQLQLRKGYVRCINCAHIFDGYEAVVPATSSQPQHVASHQYASSDPEFGVSDDLQSAGRQVDPHVSFHEQETDAAGDDSL